MKVGKTANEGIKDTSNYLRGTILEGLANTSNRFFALER